MLVDEFYFHPRRFLPLWERLGHPIDTLSVALCVTYLLGMGASVTTYTILSIFSCALVTKDEWQSIVNDVHAPSVDPVKLKDIGDDVLNTVD